MYLKQAWAKTAKSKIGIKKFDESNQIGIGNVCSNTQKSFYIGIANAKSHNRSGVLSELQEMDVIDQSWIDHIVNNPDSEFNFHQFFYPSTRGDLRFYKCLVEHSCKTTDKPFTVFESKDGVRALGYVKSTIACQSLNNILMTLHCECAKVESAARLFSKDTAVKGIVSKRLKENTTRLYFDMSDVDDCLLILEKNGWDSSKQYREAISKM